MAIGLLILYLFITIIRNIVEPKIIGKQIGLHPLATLISMFTGLKLFGIIGLFAAPITLSLLLTLYKNDVIHFSKEESAKMQ